MGLFQQHVDHSRGAGDQCVGNPERQQLQGRVVRVAHILQQQPQGGTLDEDGIQWSIHACVQWLLRHMYLG